MSQAFRHIRVTREQRELTQYRQVVVRGFVRWRDDQEEIRDRLAIDRAILDSTVRAAVPNAQAIHREGTAVRNRDAAANAGRAEALPPLQHFEEDPPGSLIDIEHCDQLAQYIVFRATVQIQPNCVSIEK